MSSGSSVLSTIPPKSARIERFTLVHSPIFNSSSSEFRFEDHGSEVRRFKTRARSHLYDAEARTVASYSRFRREYSKEQWAVGSRPKGSRGLTGGHRTYDRSL